MAPRSRNGGKGGSAASRKRKKLGTGTLMDRLPDDVALGVLTSLPWAVQARCRRVCRSWNYALLHNTNRRPFPILTGFGKPNWLLLDPLSLHCKALPQKQRWRGMDAAATAAGEDIVFVDHVERVSHLFWFNLATMQKRLLPWPYEKASRLLWSDIARAIANGYVYTAGGDDGIWSRSVHRLKLEVHDKETWVWERLPDMHEPRVSSTALVLDGCVYLLGGISGARPDGKCINSGEVFDPRTREWTLLPELWPSDIFGEENSSPPVAVVARGRLYAVTRRTLEIVYYEPATKFWKTLCSLRIYVPRLLAVGDELWLGVDGRGGKVFRTTVMPAGTTPQVPPMWKVLPPIWLKKRSCTDTLIFFTNLVAHF